MEIEMDMDKTKIILMQKYITTKIKTVTNRLLLHPMIITIIIPVPQQL